MEKKIKKDWTAALIWLVFAILIIYTLSILLLLGWGLITSLKSNMDFLTFNNKVGLPRWEYSSKEIFLAHYKGILSGFSVPIRANYYSAGKLVRVMKTVYFPTMILNSILYAVVGALVAALTACVMGYACARYPYKFSKFLSAMVLVLMMIPIVGSAPAYMTFMRETGLYDTWLGIFLEKAGFANMYFLLYLAFFEGMSTAYTEAAELDGASQLQILLHIGLPLSLKITGTITLILFIAYWDDYQTAKLYMPTHPTLALGIFEMINATNTSGFNTVPEKVAGSMLLVLPILILFICFREKLMGNLSLGGEKE